MLRKLQTADPRYRGTNICPKSIVFCTNLRKNPFYIWTVDIAVR